MSLIKVPLDDNAIKTNIINYIGFKNFLKRFGIPDKVLGVANTQKSCQKFENLPFPRCVHYYTVTCHRINKPLLIFFYYHVRPTRPI